MRCSLEIKGQALIVTAQGELDLHSSPEFKQRITALFEADPLLKHLVIDVASITFMDSSGLGVILGRYREIKERGGRLFFVRPNPQIKRILQLSGFEKISEFANSAAEVLALIRGQL